MSTFPSRRHAPLLLAFSLGFPGAGCSPAISSAVATSPDGTGDICATTDAEGLATIGWELVDNESDADVTVEGIELATEGVEVVEWAIFPPGWSGGVLRGDHIPVEDGARVIEPGETGQVAMLLRLDSQSTAVAPTLAYGRGWSSRLCRPHVACDLDAFRRGMPGPAVISDPQPLVARRPARHGE
ncbi:hypothetical protein [Georgenia sp. H159]|uniref:hypothetical protein n=1 Tax=Georgenia sp. H159 TaxID=3076115 RepID=UPI002D79E869|nr:hypothetical protein [Georgenia sp. H159]